MVAPALRAHVATRLKDEAAVAKEREILCITGPSSCGKPIYTRKCLGQRREESKGHPGLPFFSSLPSGDSLGKTGPRCQDVRLRARRLHQAC